MAPDLSVLKNGAKKAWRSTRKKLQWDRERLQNGKELARQDAKLVHQDADYAQSSIDYPRESGERSHRDAEPAQEDTDVAKPGGDQLERETCQRVEEGRQSRPEAERAAHSLEEAAADAEIARKAAVEARRVAEDRLLRGIPPEVRPTAEQIQQFRERHGYDINARNIAFAGESGVGKSALLNAIRGLWPDDPDAAAVGINETTAKVQGYVDSRHPEVKWFDIPGANTPNISGWLYFMDQGLYAFDALVIIISDRFTQTAGTLLRNAHECGIPTYLVRTKADQLIQNLKKDRRGRLTDAQARKIFIDNTRDMVQKNLLKLELPLQQVFVVSVMGMREWATEGDTTRVIDEQDVLQALFRASVDQGVPGSSPPASLD